jgi:hypothetical protein
MGSKGNDEFPLGKPTVSFKIEVIIIINAKYIKL